MSVKQYWFLGCTLLSCNNVPWARFIPVCRGHSNTGDDKHKSSLVPGRWRSSLWVSITAGNCWCQAVIFWQCQRAWGLPSGEVWGSQWSERDAGPIGTPNTRRTYTVHQSIPEPFGGSFLARCPPAPRRAALIWSAK